MDTNLLVQILVGLAVMNAVTTVAILPSLGRIEKKIGETLQTVAMVQHSQEESTRNLMSLIEKLIERVADRREY
jgi:hypothetical protein